MGPHNLEFQRRALRPWACLGEGWRVIRDDYWLFVAIAFVGVFIGRMAPLGLLEAPAMCGIHLCLLRRERNLPIRFEMLFDGFNFFLPSLVATLIVMAPVVFFAVVAYVSFYAVAIGGVILAAPPPAGPGAAPPPPPEIGIAVLGVGGVLFIGSIAAIIVIEMLTVFIYPLIVDKELSGVDALKLSCKAVWANLGGIIGLFILRFVIDLAATLVLCVGPILVLPLDIAIVAVAYRQLFAPDDPFAEFGPEDDRPIQASEPSEGIKALPNS